MAAELTLITGAGYDGTVAAITCTILETGDVETLL